MKLLFIVSLLIITACGHHRDVRPGAEGVHRVVVRAEEKEPGEREAIDQANHFCDQKDKMAAFVNENSKYTGDMNEETYKKTRMVSKAAKAAGGGAYVFGGKNESNVGGIGVLGGAAADAMAGEGYTIEMTFKCN